VGKISPFDIFSATYSNSMRWVHLFLPIAFVVALVGAFINKLFIESMFGSAMTSGTAPVMEGFWTAWLFMMFGFMAIFMFQMSLFDAILEERGDWLPFGFGRFLKRLLPGLVGVGIYMLLYMIGIVLLVIPGLMALILLYMMMPLILLDDVGPIAAVKRSFRLVWGNAWRFIGAIIVAMLPLMIVMMLVGGFLGIFGAGTEQEVMQPLTDFTDWRTWAWTVTTAILGVVATCFYLAAFRELKRAQAGDTVGAPVDDVSA
jgi:hypothetical protein